MTTETKIGYTRGPWRTRQAQSNHKFAPEERWDWAIVAGGQIIAECFWRVDEATYAPSAANARLIAATPELLEALREAIPLVEFAEEIKAREWRERNYSEPPYSLTRRARDAIAKALGEAV